MSRIVLFCVTLVILAAVALQLRSPHLELAPEPEIALVDEGDAPGVADERSEGDFGITEAVFRRTGDDEAGATRVLVEGAASTPDALVPPAQQTKKLKLRLLDPAGTPLVGTEARIGLRPSGRVLAQAFEGRRGPREERARRTLATEKALSGADGKAPRTGRDGRIELEIAVWEESVVEVLVVPARFAPTIWRKSFRAAEGDLDLGDLRVDPGGKVLGTVLDRSGAPIVGAEIVFEPELRGRWDPRERLTEVLPERRSDELGRFELGALPEGFFRFRIETERHLPWRSERLRIEGGNEIAAGTIRLEIGGVLRGRVRDDRGQLIADARVRVHPQPSAEQHKAWGQLRGNARREAQKNWQSQAGRPAEVRSDAEGRFELARLPHVPLRIEVQHGKHVTARQGPLLAVERPFVEIEMERRLALRGLVVDARTGGPIAQYGIRARRIGNPAPTPQDRAREALERQQKAAAAKAQNDAVRAAKAREAAARRPAPRPKSPQQLERERQLAERRQQQQAQQARELAERRQREQLERQRRENERAWMQQRIGGSGIPARGVPSSTAHPEGRFELPDLEPGRYVLDVGTEGYVAQAAGPFDVAKGRPLPEIRIRLEPGLTLHGIVRDARDGQPLEGAHVELVLPAFQQQTDPRRGQSALFAAMRPERSGRRLFGERTAQDGRFAFDGLRPGNYELHVRRKDYDRLELDPLILNPGTRHTELPLVLQPGAEVFGRVHGYDELKKGYVLLVSTDGERRQAGIDPKTHEYRARGLESGSWFVRIAENGRRGGPIATLVEAVSRPGAERPDVYLRAGQQQRLDLDARGRAIGAIEGRILIANRPGRGLEVEAEPHEELLKNLQPDDPMAFVRRMVQQFSKATCDAQGRFRIEPLPPGTYRLVVRRRTKNEARVLHGQDITVHGTRPAQLNLALQLGELEIEAVRATDGKPAQLGITLVPAHEAGDRPPKEWRKLSGTRSARLQGGRAKLPELAGGDYRYVVYGGGFRSFEGRTYIGLGTSRLSLRVQPVPRGGDRRRSENAARGSSSKTPTKKPGTPQAGKQPKKAGPAQPGPKKAGPKKPGPKKQ